AGRQPPPAHAAQASQTDHVPASPHQGPAAQAAQPGPQAAASAGPSPTAAAPGGTQNAAPSDQPPGAATDPHFGGFPTGQSPGGFSPAPPQSTNSGSLGPWSTNPTVLMLGGAGAFVILLVRSEERRVGKGGEARWSP